MIDPNMLQYFTTAAWARGYADGLDKYEHDALKTRLYKIADMLDCVFNSYIEHRESEDGLDRTGL